jgi:hypothetical protein
MKRFSICLAAIAVAGTVSSAPAQRVSADFRFALAAPSEQVAGTDLETGLGVGAVISLRLMPRLHLYGGWDWMQFPYEALGVDRDLQETGYTFGLRFEQSLRADAGVRFRAEAGGTLKHIEIEDDNGNLIADSGHDWGFELGTGIRVPFGTSWSAVPMLRYRSLGTEFRTGSIVTKADLRYFGFELGLSRHF